MKRKIVHIDESKCNGCGCVLMPAMKGQSKLLTVKHG